MNITVIGTIYIDIKGHPFETLGSGCRNAGYIEYVHGGVGRNIAEDLAAVGETPVLVSLCEPGGKGDEVLSHLTEAGVDTRFIARTEHGSGSWLAVFNEKGEVASSISARADDAPLADLIERHHEEIFAQTDLVILEFDIDPEALRKTLDYARQYGKKVCCAVATISEALDQTGYLRQADLFICNQQEAGVLFGEDLRTDSPAEILAKTKQYLRDTGLKSMVVTLSERGSVYAGPGGEEGICPAVPAAVKDTTGAGDAYCAGLCAALAKGHSLGDACLFGTRVSSSVVASEGNIYSGSERTP